MATYSFEIELQGIGLGCVEADSKEEAIKKINNGEYEDIYDHVNIEYGKIIDIEKDT